MTDEELLKRVAEILGIQKRTTAYGFFWEHKDNPRVPIAMEWNPLANWSDLGPLIEKYKVELTPYVQGGDWGAEVTFKDGRYINLDAEILHASLPHAILLAIVEAESE